MTELEKLKEAKKLSQLAKLLGYKTAGDITYILHIRPDELNADKKSPYKEFQIPKKRGGVRIIKAPHSYLKELQRRLSKLLQSCFEEIHSKRSFRKNLSHGFRKEHSIITNALCHKRKKYVFNIDLKDFFPSINFGRVRGFFIKNKHFQLDPKIATIIAQIACFDNQLPQGSPVSPVISNMIGAILDLRLDNHAKKVNCTYTRYADDITFSTREKAFPKEIAESKDNEWQISFQIEEVIKRSGFSVNHKKTSMQHSISRQTVTGLVVNKRVNIPASYYYRTRSMCHRLFTKKDIFFEYGNHTQRNSSKNILERGINRLQGMISHIYLIKATPIILKINGDKKKLHHKKQTHEDLIRVVEEMKETGIGKLYEKFLHFVTFHAPCHPLIICEGKTDITYLKCAMKKEASNMKKVMKPVFLSSMKTRYLIGLNEGVKQTTECINIYKKYNFDPSTREANPVIFLLDNDDTGQKQFQAVINSSKTDVNTKEGYFSHIIGNIYAVKLPLKNEKPNIEIEDYFPNIVKKSDKKFFLIKNGQEISKAKLARLIKNNQENIDFSHFKELLSIITKIIHEHRQKDSPSTNI